MRGFNPTVFSWARQSAGLSLQEAASASKIAAERIEEFEQGAGDPTDPQLMRLARTYRRPLVAFYMDTPPPAGDRGKDFRTVSADRTVRQDALVDALMRDVQSRQGLVRSALEDDEAPPVEFIGSLGLQVGVEAVKRSIETRLNISTGEYRAQGTPDAAFNYLRAAAEGAGVFVLLLGNLGSHHSSIPVETFRGFAIADRLAPFVVINDQDARPAWSFTLIHELVHLWIGETGISAGFGESRIEKFCNDVAGSFLFSADEAANLRIEPDDQERLVTQIVSASKDLLVSRQLVAYRLFMANRLTEDQWLGASSALKELWAKERIKSKEDMSASAGGPNYYVVKRHRLGSGLVAAVRRAVDMGFLSPVKAAQVLGVKPRSVQTLLAS